MYKVPINEIKEKIISSGKLDSEALEEKIKTKINELSGLISEEGAAHIIANELGIELVKENTDQLKIKEIYAGMKNINTAGKVVRKFDVHEFAKGDSTGKVCSLVMGDETGSIRVVFWNEQVDLIKEVNQDDIIAVKNSYVRENKNNKEIHLGERGEVEVNPDGIVIDKVRQGSSFERKAINELADGTDGVELMGTVVQVFDPRFFHVCPTCSKRATDGNCAEHGTVTPSLSYVLNLVLDDGTGTIRGVFWKNQTNHLLDADEEKMENFKSDMAQFEDVKNDLLGEQFKLMGRVKRNDMFERLEFNVQIVEKANPQEEIEKVEAVAEKIESAAPVEKVEPVVPVEEPTTSVESVEPAEAPEPVEKDNLQEEISKL
jgi:ssDNA-binding replication factor A large subunit